MSFKIVEIFSGEISNLWLEKITSFCKLAYDENKHEAHKNMLFENWQFAPSSLLYLLCIEKRFERNNGGFQLLVDSENTIVAVSGYYKSDFYENAFIIGVRSWVIKQFRHNLLIAEHLLPYQLQELSKRKADFAVITFNESTKAFAKLIERSNKNAEANRKFFFADKYPQIYRDMQLWPEPVKIKNVKQWILIKKLSNTHFDWSKLNWNKPD